MCQAAAEMSEADIAEIATYFSVMEFVAAQQDFDAALADAGARIHTQRCKKCHADAGSDPWDDAGILAGQWTEYLRGSLEGFRTGVRPVDEKMLQKLEQLSDEDAEALLNYWAREGNPQP